MAKRLIDPTTPMQWEFCWKVFACGLGFLVLSLGWPDAMSPSVYGKAAYDVPAEVWSMAFMSASLLVIYGLHINGRKPLLTPLLRIAGYGLLLALFLYLILSAASAPDGAVIIVFGSLFFVPTILRHLTSTIRLWLFRMKDWVRARKSE